MLVLVVFHKMAFTNLILARGDTFLYFYPYWQAASDALHTGRVPLWNSQLFMGAPLLANSQMGFFYPLNWPFWWFFAVPYAVSGSILLHLVIAGWGAYLAGRRTLGLSRMGGLVTAVLFALGGYITAQVEHINQLQGIAWLPWFWVVLPTLQAADSKQRWRAATAVALLFSLQLLAGHSQTTFITGVGVGVWLVASLLTYGQESRMWASRMLLPLLVGGLLAGLITAVQLLPTLELTRFSSRQGGLPVNEVLSFSLHPLLLGHSLLPAYGQSLFTEYVAWLPVSGLILAMIGGWRWRKRRELWPLLLLIGIAIFLALGVFNPANWVLARMPGFSFFRVPARWLVLYAFGMALLAGRGWDEMVAMWHQGSGAWKRPFRWGGLLLIILMLWRVISVPLAVYLPVGPEAPPVSPNLFTWLGWLVELLLCWFWLAYTGPVIWRQGGLLLAGSLALFLASRSQPFNNLTTPEAYFDLRPSITRLLAETRNSQPTDRLLSLSDIFFDPGDQAEINTIYQDQLSAAALYDYTIAIKQKEIIAPNLPLAYGLASVDGFDGGILPLSSYSQLTRLVLPAGHVTTDGRLREHLDAVPEARWLDLFNVRYLITDKVGDAWREGVFFDLQHPVTLTEPVRVGYIPEFAATEVRFLADGAPAWVEMDLADGRLLRGHPVSLGDGLFVVSLQVYPYAVQVKQMAFHPAEGTSVTVRGVSLINQLDGTFYPLVLGAYRLIHSGDVKIYENLDVLPRAFLVGGWQWVADQAEALRRMQAAGFVPGETAVLLGQGEDKAIEDEVAEGRVTVLQYEPERVVLETHSEQPALLVLTDAFYPGWRAWVDGQETAVYPTDILFRGVFVPAGTHEVLFSYHPRSYQVGRWISLAGILLWLLISGIINNHK